MNKELLISIIIPTYNSGSNLDACLKSIKEQTYKNVEIIVIERSSKENIENKDNIKIIRGDYNKPEARNIGINNSKGDILFFADSDYVLEKGLINEVANTINGYDALFISEEYIGNGYVVNCRNLEKDIYQGIEIIEAPRVYKRWIIEKVSFDENNEGPDEYDFYANALDFGIKTGRIKSKIYLSRQSLNLKKKFRHGKFFVYYQNKHKKNNTIQRQVDMNYRLSLILRAFKISPIRTSGLFIIKSLEFSIFSLGRFMGTFDKKIQMSSVSAKDEFNSIGQDYERDMYQNSLGNKFVDDTEKKIIIKRVKDIFKDRKIKVLDVGAGNGRWSREFLKLGYDVTSLDISENMCKHIKDNNVELKVVCGNIENVDIDEKFDLIFSFRNFKYVRDMEKALKNMKKLLKEGGYIIVEMPNKNNPFYLLANAVAPILYGVTGKIGKHFILANLVTEREFEEKLDNLSFDIKKEELLAFPHKFYSIVDNKYLLSAINIIDQSLTKIMPRSIIYSLKMGNSIGNDGTICGGNDGGNDIGLIEEQPLVSIVIPTYNRKEKLIRLIKSIQGSNYKNLEIIVVDDASTDGTYDIIKKMFPNIQIIRNNEQKLSAFSRNKGMKNSKGEYVFFIDDDNVINDNAINKLVCIMEQDKSIQVIAPLMLYYSRPDTVWCAGGKLDKFLRPYHLYKDQRIDDILCKLIDDVDYFPNAYMIRKNINILNDDKTFPHNWAEIDLCLRIKKVGRLVTHTGAYIWHDIGHGRTMTRFSILKTRDQAISRILFLKKYGNIYQKTYFWTLIFPLSTMYYLYIIFLSRNGDIIKKDDDRIQILKSYINGTVKGIKTGV